MRPRVLVLRGHQANPWELAPWELLLDRYDARYLRTGSGWFDDSLLSVPAQPARALRDLLPAGRAGDLAVRLPGDRYLGLAATLRGAQIVHTQELGYWYSMQAARHKRRLGYKLLTTVWETIPFLGAYRNARTRPYRRAVLAETDLFLAATERARAALMLEGVAPERIRVSPPGVDVGRFRRAPDATTAPASHVVLSPGRLVWEKGHQDVLRAVAAIRGGLVSASVEAPRVVFAGSGADEPRLRAYARRARRGRPRRLPLVRCL